MQTEKKKEKKDFCSTSGYIFHLGEGKISWKSKNRLLFLYPAPRQNTKQCWIHVRRVSGCVACLSHYNCVHTFLSSFMSTIQAPSLYPKNLIITLVLSTSTKDSILSANASRTTSSLFSMSQHMTCQLTYSPNPSQE